MAPDKSDGRPAPLPADRGILVTGLPRTGTSWTGKMLAAGREVVYVNEPLNPDHPPGHSPGVLNTEVRHRFQYICADNDERWAAAFADTLRLRYHPIAELRRNHRPYDLARLAKYSTAFTAGRLKDRRTLIDDPYAVLSAAWFAQRLGCQVVITVRHPVAFVASWQRLGWTPSLGGLLDQPLLVRDLIGPYAGEIRALADSPDDIATTSLLWRMTYDIVDQMAGQQPHLLCWRRYEDLATDPVAGFRGLYQQCDLRWTDRVADGIRASCTGTGKSAAFQWTLRGGLSRTAFQAMDSRAALTSYRDRLTPEAIERVQELTADVARRFYPAHEMSS
jgi:Sulfotransferase family